MLLILSICLGVVYAISKILHNFGNKLIAVFLFLLTFLSWTIESRCQAAENLLSNNRAGERAHPFPSPERVHKNPRASR